MSGDIVEGISGSSRVWATSDTHFRHWNIIEYCNRPFRTPDGQLDVDQMDDELVRRWNESVGPEDWVVHVGDFALTNLSVIAAIRSRLRGRVALVLGNHDRHSASAYRRAGFDFVAKSMTLDLSLPDLPGRVHFRHDPARVSEEDAASCDVVLCGHVHERWVVGSSRGRPALNVGVDVRDYRPVLVADLLKSLPGLI